MTVVWFRILVQNAVFPQPTQVSAASTGFRSHFVKRYATGVLRENEPHGQVPVVKDMGRVPPDHPEQP